MIPCATFPCSLKYLKLGKRVVCSGSAETPKPRSKPHMLDQSETRKPITQIVCFSWPEVPLLNLITSLVPSSLFTTATHKMNGSQTSERSKGDLGLHPARDLGLHPVAAMARMQRAWRWQEEQRARRWVGCGDAASFPTPTPSCLTAMGPRRPPSSFSTAARWLCNTIE
jgi:hypothetical protein